MECPNVIGIINEKKKFQPKISSAKKKTKNVVNKPQTGYSERRKKKKKHYGTSFYQDDKQQFSFKIFSIGNVSLIFSVRFLLLLLLSLMMMTDR